MQAIADYVTHAVTGDARDRPSSALGVRNHDCAIVAVADDVGTVPLITMNLWKEIGVKQVIAKAQSHVHQLVLQKIGGMVVFPEHEPGVKLAQNPPVPIPSILSSSPDDFGIVELPPRKPWQGHSISDLDVRAKYGVTIIAVPEGRWKKRPV